MLDIAESNGYAGKVKGVLFSDVGELFVKGKERSSSEDDLVEAELARTAVTSPNASAIEQDDERKVAIGQHCCTFLREIRIKSEKPAARPKKKKNNSFWKEVLDKRAKDSPYANKKEKTNVCIELGGWVNLPYGLQTTLSLVVEYFDGVENCRFKIDSCDSKGAIQVLLSGSCDIVADCSVETIKLYCYGIEDKSVWIENLSFDCKDLAAKSR